MFRTEEFDTYRHGTQLNNNKKNLLGEHIASLGSSLQVRTNENIKMFNAMRHCLLQTMNETDRSTLQDPAEREATLVKDKADILGQNVCTFLA